MEGFTGKASTLKLPPNCSTTHQKPAPESELQWLASSANYVVMMSLHGHMTHAESA